jgi:hypothetical protein
VFRAFYFRIFAERQVKLEYHYVSPLHWPSAIPRNFSRRRAAYRLTFVESHDAVIQELLHLGAVHIVVTSNVPETGPDLTACEIEDPGIAVFFTLANNEKHVIACDRWTIPKDNLRAIALSLESERRKSRAGGSAARVTHVRALGSHDRNPKNWRSILAIPKDVPSRADLRKAYKRAALQAHPDLGGTNERMHLISDAYRFACRELNYL